MTRTSHFFDHLRDHTEIKLRILRKFVRPWSAKLGYKTRARGGKRIWYVDGFAGPGTYKDGAEGSPIIGAGQALSVLRAASGHILGCVNVELDSTRYQALCRETHPYRQQGVPISNLKGDFSEVIPEILKIVGQADAILVFIDPFGVKPLKFDKLRPLVSRPGETDLFLTFQTSAVYRLVAQHPQYVTQAVGSDDWRPAWAKRGVQAVLDTLSENLGELGHFLDVARYAIRPEKQAAAKYHLVIASRSYHAFELVNDFVCQEEKTLNRKYYAKLAQSSFLPLVDAEESAGALVAAILEFGQSHPRTTRPRILEHVVLRHWGRWHTGEIKNAVSGLIDAGRILREKRVPGRIDTDPLTFA
jgi:three-Cys-motif partner protein